MTTHILRVKQKLQNQNLHLTPSSSGTQPHGLSPDIHHILQGRVNPIANHLVILSSTLRDSGRGFQKSSTLRQMDATYGLILDDTVHMVTIKRHKIDLKKLQFTFLHQYLDFFIDNSMTYRPLSKIPCTIFSYVDYCISNMHRNFWVWFQPPKICISWQSYYFLYSSQYTPGNPAQEFNVLLFIP